MSAELFASADREGKAYDGDCKPLRGGTIDVIEPATGDILGRAGRANPLCACAPAKTSRSSWAKMAHRDRATIFGRAAAVLKHNRAGVARLIGRETGRIVLKACLRSTPSSTSCMKTRSRSGTSSMLVERPHHVAPLQGRQRDCRLLQEHPRHGFAGRNRRSRALDKGARSPQSLSSSTSAQGTFSPSSSCPARYQRVATRTHRSGLSISPSNSRLWRRLNGREG
jgi:hypothetical protein